VSKVFIDPGHGGKDPGAVVPLPGTSAQVLEKNLNLLISLDMRRLNLGHDLLLSRDTDTWVSLKRRVSMANSWPANAFVAIHCNASDAEEPHGVEVLYYPGSKRGKKLAKEIEEAVKITMGSSRGLKERPDLYVLHRTRMPAVLVECGFMTNPQDLAILTSEYQALALAILSGISKALV